MVVGPPLARIGRPNFEGMFDAALHIEIRKREAPSVVSARILREQAEAGTGVAPHLLEVATNSIDALVMEAVDPPRSLGPISDQSCFFEKAQMP